MTTYDLERAFEIVIKAIPGFPSDTVNVYRGADFDAHQAPCVVIWAKGGPEEPRGSGNHFHDVAIVIKRHAVEDPAADGSNLNPIEDMEALVATVLNGLPVGDPDLDDDPDGLAAKLNAAVPGGIGAYHPILETATEPDLQDVSYIHTRTFRVYG